MSLDPRIGQLSSGKCYAYLNGYDKPEFVGTLEEVEVALGIRHPESPSSKPRDPKKTKSNLRTYQVTVTPVAASYAGSMTFGEYTVEVDAASRSQAITKVRQERNEVEGRYGVRATYRARIWETE